MSGRRARLWLVFDYIRLAPLRLCVECGLNRYGLCGEVLAFSTLNGCAYLIIPGAFSVGVIGRAKVAPAIIIPWVDIQAMTLYDNLAGSLTPDQKHCQLTARPGCRANRRKGETCRG